MEPRKPSTPPYHFCKFPWEPDYVYWIDAKGVPAARITEMQLIRGLLTVKAGELFNPRFAKPFRP